MVYWRARKSFAEWFELSNRITCWLIFFKSWFNNRKKKKRNNITFVVRVPGYRYGFTSMSCFFSFIRNLMHVGDRRTKAPRLHVLINWLTRFQLRGLGRNRLILYVQWIFFTEEWKGPRKTLMHPYTYIFTFFAVAPTLFFFFHLMSPVFLERADNNIPGGVPRQNQGCGEKFLSN